MERENGITEKEKNRIEKKRERRHRERGRSDFSLSRDEERSGAGELPSRRK